MHLRPNMDDSFDDLSIQRTSLCVRSKRLLELDRIMEANRPTQNLSDGTISCAVFPQNSQMMDSIFDEMPLWFEDENHALTESYQNGNVEGKLASIVQEMHNLCVIPHKGNGQSGSLDFGQLTEATYELVQLYHQRLAQFDELNDRHVKLVADFASLQQNHRRLNDSLEQKERIIAVQQEKERVLKCETRTLASRIKANKDEIRKLNAVIQSRESQYRSDLRKNEIQMRKLQDKLGTLVMDRNCLRRPGMDIVKQIPRKDGSRGKWNSSTTFSKSEEQMHETLISTFERRCSALSEEHNGTRANLKNVSEKLEELCQKADMFVATAAPSSTVCDSTAPLPTLKNDAGDTSIGYSSNNTSNEYPNAAVNATVFVQLQKLETFIKLITAKQCKLK